MAARAVVNVAAGVVYNAGGDVLTQRRRRGQACAGFWEFPGGKIEDGEDAAAALRRELHEELNISVITAHAWLRRRHDYEHAAVNLNFFRVFDWQGDIAAGEGQVWRWRPPRAAPPQPLLDANLPVWKWLRLPDICVVTAAELTGVDDFLPRAAARLARGDAPVVQLRDKTLPPAERLRLAKALRRLTRRHDSLLLINDDETLAKKIKADGVHLSSKRLAECAARPAFEWAAASCHTTAELRRAADLGLDFAVFSPVQKTLTHVKQPPLGWAGFARLTRAAALPVYALGGLGESDMQTAQTHGAHGIGMMRRAWGI